MSKNDGQSVILAGVMCGGPALEQTEIDVTGCGGKLSAQSPNLPPPLHCLLSRRDPWLDVSGVGVGKPGPPLPCLDCSVSDSGRAARFLVVILQVFADVLLS